VGQAIDVDTNRVLYTMELRDGRGSEAIKAAGRWGYEVVDFYVTFHEADVHTLTFYIRKKRKQKK